MAKVPVLRRKIRSWRRSGGDGRWTSDRMSYEFFIHIIRILHRKLFREKLESVPFGYLLVLVRHGLRVIGSRKSRYFHRLNPLRPRLWTRIPFVHDQRRPLQHVLLRLQ